MKKYFPFIGYQSNPALLVVVVFMFNGCAFLSGLDEVLPDNRNKYQQSQSLPNLDIPPDLTADALDDPLTIGDEEPSNTLSEFNKRAKTSSYPGSADVEVYQLTDASETSFAVSGPLPKIWEALQKFCLEKGFVLSIDDIDLGVIETQFKDITTGDSIARREKFNFFVEKKETLDSVVLFVDGEVQSRNQENEGEWISGKSDERVAALAEELAVYLSGDKTAGNQPSNVESEPDAVRPGPVNTESAGAEIIETDKDRKFLVIYSEFFMAWNEMETILEKNGIHIENKEQENGLYHVIYYPPENKEEQGLLDKLAFWKSDDMQKLQISLTGVGNKTEVLVTDEKGNWLDSPETLEIFSMIQGHYN